MKSGSKRREKGLAASGNARVRRGLIQLAWRFLLFQKNSALAQWLRNRTKGVKEEAKRTKMIVALARQLLIALWCMVYQSAKSPARRRVAGSGLISFADKERKQQVSARPAGFVLPG